MKVEEKWLNNNRRRPPFLEECRAPCIRSWRRGCVSDSALAFAKVLTNESQPNICANASNLTARGESLASHREGRGAPPARRDDREYREYLSEEQRSRWGCIARRMQPDFHHGLLNT